MKLRVLDLFSGIGGFSLGLERAGMQTVAFCEIEDYPRRVLKKHWPDVPLFDDVRKLRGSDVGPVDLICGGYPCQPFSLAGDRKGQEDDRHLWPEVARLIREIRPRWFIGENVAGHISMGLDSVLSDLEGLGYTWEAFVVPACGVDAPHRRDRLWIVANTSGRRCCAAEKWEIQQQGSAEIIGTSATTNTYSNTIREQSGGGRGENRQCAPQPELYGATQPLANSDSDRRDQRRDCEPTSWGHGFVRNSRWEPEPRVGRVAHGVPCRVDRLRALGNAVVPQVVEVIGRAIMEEEATRRAIEIVAGMHCSQEAFK